MACNSTVDSEQIPPSANHQSEKVGHTNKDQLLSVSDTIACPSIVLEERSGYVAGGSKSDLMKPSATGTDAMCYANETGGGIMRQLNDGVINLPCSYALSCEMLLAILSFAFSAPMGLSVFV